MSHLSTPVKEKRRGVCPSVYFAQVLRSVDRKFGHVSDRRSSDRKMARWPDHPMLCRTKLTNNRVASRCYPDGALVSRMYLR